MNVYDFDETIYRGDSTVNFYLFCLKKKIKLLKYVPKQLKAILLYKIGKINKQQLKETFFGFLLEVDTTPMVQEFWDKNSHKIKKWYLENQKEDDVVISASPTFLLQPICEKLGIQNLIATELNPNTRKMEGENCKGKQKVQAFREYFKEATINNFYSDSLSDSPMAEIATNAFMVRGNKIQPWPTNLNSHNKILLYLMILVAIILCLPSIMYLLAHHTANGFGAYYTYSLILSDNQMVRNLSGLTVIGLMLAFSIMYLMIIRREKKIFKNKKEIIVFITIVSFIFMMIMPFLSSDIFYYMGDSWLASKYHENPYYTTVQDLQDNGINDEILSNTGFWKDTTSVYGPLYVMISIGLSWLSFGSVTAALFIFKVASLIIHMANCYLVGRITKSNKYILTYGLNPLVLLELLSNVHNDIYLLCFVLLSLYYLIRKKKKGLSFLFLALSIAIKFSTILLVPFILIYAYREYDIGKRIVYCMLSGIAIVGIVVLLYMPFYRDITIFKNMLAQGDRSSQSFMALALVKLKRYPELIGWLRNIRLPAFACLYICMVTYVLCKRNVTLEMVLRKYNLLMLVFIFVVLTNFQKWYVLWLLPTIIWQKKYMRNFILALTVVAIIPSYTYFKIQNDFFIEGIYYSFMMLVWSALITVMLELRYRFKVQKQSQ